MSGSPKKSVAQLRREQEERLARQRAAEAKKEEERRRKAAEEERQRQLQLHRGEVATAVAAADRDITAGTASVLANDATQLRQRAEQLAAGVAKAPDEAALQQAQAELEKLRAAFLQAQARKRRDDEERQRRAEIDRMRFEYAELQRQLQQLPAPQMNRFAPANLATAQTALQALQTALAGGDPKVCQAPLSAAQQAVAELERVLRERIAAWEQQKAAAEAAYAELQALLAGLQADALAQRWGAAHLAALRELQRQSAAALAAEEFTRPAQLLLEAQARERTLLEEANTAELAANRRDYIAQAIAQSLQEMGFFVDTPALEDSHPLSAVAMQARNASGQSVQVSVPVDGEVWYNVNGFPMTAEPTTDGDLAPTCDEAERVLLQMHQVMDEAFGVEMGEVDWEGRVDPDRILVQRRRHADDISRGGQR